MPTSPARRATSVRVHSARSPATVAPPTSPYGSFQGAAVTQRLMVIHGNLTF